MITLIENLILKIKKKIPLTLNIKFRAFLSAGYDEDSSVCILAANNKGLNKMHECAG